MNMVLLVIMLSSLSGDGADIFDQANEAYYQGDNIRAIAGYERLISEFGVKSPALFYNLGNAWFKEGRLGKAVLYYEAALALDPRFDAASKNLETVLKNTKRHLPAPDRNELNRGAFLHYYPFTPMQSLLLTHAALAAALVLLFVCYRRGTPRVKWLYRFSLVFAAVFFALTVGSNLAARNAPKLAVTVRDEAPVYFSMNELESPRFLLYEGDRVLIDRIEGDWARVYAYGGERGWTRKDNTGIVEYSGI
ncbi:MAG TPA: tetratricopeptide repeat protein [Candidatus Hydrogenedentes bacterium]|nr:tetratricopeptide repeat protein [Candidatus Hydrogenedentota bacterium]